MDCFFQTNHEFMICGFLFLVEILRIPTEDMEEPVPCNFCVSSEHSSMRDGYREGMTGKMAILWWIPLAILVISILMAGCSRNPEVFTAGTGEMFTLGTGQSALIRGEDMVITFDEVTADSRCPQGVVCIWAGEARSRITITQGGIPHTLVLVQPGLSENAQETFGLYTLTHRLSPYPREGEAIAPNQYRLTLMVTK